MKKIIALLITVFLMVDALKAQETKTFEVKDVSGIVRINGGANKLQIIGHNGNSILIEAEVNKGKAIPEEAKGLKLVTSGGIDNTDIGINLEKYTTNLVTEINKDGSEIVIETPTFQLNLASTENTMYKNYTFKVPNNILLQISRRYENWTKGKLEIDTFTGELEINSYNFDIEIKDFSGNMVVKNTGNSNTRISFKELSQNKISSISSYGDIEIMLPEKTPSNLKLNTYKGNIYTDLDLKSKSENNNLSINTTIVHGEVLNIHDDVVIESEQIVDIASKATQTVKGRLISKEKNVKTKALGIKSDTSNYNYFLNDGGVYFTVSSYDGNIYLRKK